MATLTGASMKFDHDKFINLYKSQYGPLDGSQASGLRGLLEQDNQVTDVRARRLGDAPLPFRRSAVLI